MDKRVLILRNLADVALYAIEYVGSANYPEREIHAIREVRRAYDAAIAGRVHDIKWHEDTSENDS